MLCPKDSKVKDTYEHRFMEEGITWFSDHNLHMNFRALSFKYTSSDYLEHLSGEGTEALKERMFGKDDRV